jgi:hypothetical protein
VPQAKGSPGRDDTMRRRIAREEDRAARTGFISNFLKEARPPSTAHSTVRPSVEISTSADSGGGGSNFVSSSIGGGGSGNPVAPSWVDGLPAPIKGAIHVLAHDADGKLYWAETRNC